MVDVVLLFGRLLLLAALYLFVYATVRTGIGLVRSGTPTRADRPLGLVVVGGPQELKGVKVSLDRAVRIGREPGSELVVADDFVSQRHAQVVPGPDGPIVEDLGSTNGTLLNGSRLSRPALLKAGDEVSVGAVKLKVTRL